MKIQGKTAAQIVDCVRALVQSQQLLPGQALPPVRELAAELDINRNTVAAAYKRLAAAGIALTQGRLGTVIRDPYGAGEQEGALPDTPLTDLASGNPGGNGCRTWRGRSPPDRTGPGSTASRRSIRAWRPMGAAGWRRIVRGCSTST